MLVRIKISWHHPHNGIWTSDYKDYKLYIIDCYVTKTFQWTVRKLGGKEIDGISDDFEAAKDKVREILQKEQG